MLGGQLHCVFVCKGVVGVRGGLLTLVFGTEKSDAKIYLKSALIAGKQQHVQPLLSLLWNTSMNIHHCLKTVHSFP